MITLPCGHIIVPCCDIVTSYNGGHNSYRTEQTTERLRIVNEMTARGYTRVEIIKYTGIPRKAIDRMVERKQVSFAPRAQSQPPQPPVDPKVGAFWKKWDARRESTNTARRASKDRTRIHS